MMKHELQIITDLLETILDSSVPSQLDAAMIDSLPIELRWPT